MDAYCENGQCRVVLFRAGADGHLNCPGCGQFGRLKDDPKTD